MTLRTQNAKKLKLSADADISEDVETDNCMLEHKKQRLEAIEKLSRLSTKEKLNQTKLAEHCRIIITYECDCWVAVDLDFEKVFASNIYSFEVGDKITLLFRKTPDHSHICLSVFKPSYSQITVTNCKGQTVSFHVQQKKHATNYSESRDRSYRLANADMEIGALPI